MMTSKVGLMGGGGTRSVTISSNQSKYNLRTAMGSPSGPQRIIVTINSGVEITSDNASVPAFDEGSGWASGTVITIINNGKIYGMGGAGGSSATINYISGSFTTVIAGANGGAGGTALALRVPTTVDNSAGEIFGGGGGGGGGGGASLVDFDMFIDTGGGGGGGRGGATSSAGTAGTSNISNSPPDFRINIGSNGSTGSVSGVGSGGSGGGAAATGGSGGDWGASGSNGGDSTGNYPVEFSIAAFTSGGAGGNAVALNGNAITWLGGNDSSRVKGSVS